MLTFKLFQSGLYLTEADVANPSTARVGFLFQDSKRTDPTFELNPTSWADKNSQGYFCFFAPASSLAWQRPWGTFAANIRKAFVASAGSQFAFFTDDSTGAVNAATTLLISGQGTSSPTLDGTATFASRNVTLQITPSPFASVSIAWDDANNQFTIDNSGSPTPTQFIFGTNPGYLSTSPQLLLPLTGDSAGSINAAFQFAPSDLDLFETGLMYFAPPQSSGANLTALSYPVLRGPGGATGPLNFSFWFDVLDPLDDERTYFQIIETALGSYFAAANGDIFKFNITQTGPVQSLSRLVFNNRPIQTIQDNRNFYLAPAGAFSLALDSASAKGDSGPSSAILLCGVMGTEFFNASLTAGAADSITFVPSQPAYASGDGTSSQQLDNSGGNTVTSWAQFTTSAGSYVSQPEQGPLFQQSDSSKVSLAENNSDGNNVHLLSFLPLAAWQPNSKTPVASPAVPLVPYSGIAASVDLTPYRQMETSALNPTRKNLMAAAPHTTAKLAVAAVGGGTTTAMTPQGLLSILTTDTPPVWTGLQIATSSGNRTLQFTNMGAVIRTALNQNRIFAVISTLGPTSAPLFAFAGSDNEIDISDWVFSLSPAGEPSPAPACIPPIVIMKFYDGQTLEDLANDTSLWSSPDQLNTGSFNAAAAQQYIQGVIADARKSVAKDANSLYANFVSVVTDPNFSGILALNSNLQLNDLPDAIQAVLGGMTKTVDDKTVSNVDAFRAHHVGIAINDTDPNNPQPVLSQSSLFALVDYEKPSDSQSAAADTPAAVDYGFEVEYLRALFLNSELRSFACQINLTVNKLFDIGVNLLTGGKAAGDGGDANVIQIMGSYQDHSGGSGQSQGVYSFVTQHSFSFNFQNSQYLDNITLDKLQFSFSKSSQSGGGSELHIGARFAIWGSMKFKALDVLDVFSIDSLAFADLGITVDFDLQLNPPQTSNLTLAFSPGDLRLDLGATKNREGSSSLLALLPFRLTSFLYSQNADQTLESLNYFRLAAVEGLGAVADTFNYALLFDLDLGSIGALVGSLSAFKFGFLIGWLNGGGVAFGVQMPEADGKLEIKIEGILDLLIEEFKLQYVTPTNGDPKMLVVVLHNSSITILGQRMPPSGNMDFALFKPSDGDARIGWLVAYNNEGGNSGDKPKQLEASAGPKRAIVKSNAQPAGDSGSVLDIKYLGLGQRVGPEAGSTPTNFADFLAFMTGDFWTAISKNNYSDVYQPDGGWLAVADLNILSVLQVGFVFYDNTPFYSLTLNVVDLFNFEITYTKVTDTIGLFYADLSLPDNLRTFQAGAASITLPSLAVSVYTNGNWKVDLGFPKGDDWSRCFQIQCMVGPVPVTGAGGFYIASLSSATDNIFIDQYPSILAFGLAARLGVGKDFTAGPLSAGVSVTFFGIIEGAVGYLTSSGNEIFSAPDALMLSGQFGLIGQIYGSLDFKIIKASVNVTLSASIGIILHLEKNVPGFDGSILLYITASVSVSVSVSIDFGIFSISISFSFDATFRFQWTLLGPSPKKTPMFLAAERPRLAATPSTIDLLPGLDSALPLWFLPELTMVYSASQNAGAPYFALSLSIQFTPSWSQQNPPYSAFTPFEALAAQMTTWALTEALNLSAYNSPVNQSDLSNLDQNPDQFLSFLTYNLLIQQLGVFTGSKATVLQGQSGVTYNATSFPMPPFMQVITTGRVDSSNNPAEFNYLFSANNLVSQTYLNMVDAYLNQLFVNQSQDGSTQQLQAADSAPNIPLSQQMFLEYFGGLMRSGVHILLSTMEDANQATANLDQVISSAVGAGRFASLAGQMASIYRGGARLPYIAGLTVPGGTATSPTTSLYSLLWQQFPVGNFSSSNQYTIQLAQPDGTQKWLSSDVNYILTSAAVSPYSSVTLSQITMPSAPTLIPFTNSGPQSFSFGTQTAWTGGPTSTSSLRRLPPAMLQLTNSESGYTGMVVMSRQAGSAYMNDGTALAPSAFQWSTTIQLILKQIPQTSNGTGFLPNIYAVSGASQADQHTLQTILDAIATNDTIASIQVLYQSSAGASGLNSAAVNATDVFLLRTNTTTVSAPPVQMMLAAMATVDSGVAVGAQIDNHKGFLQILEQASVTNAPGYYLRYKDAAGNDLPADLFLKGPIAPVTILITFTADGSQNTQSSPAQVESYYNTLILDAPDSTLVYYAVTVDPSLNLQYAAVAPGAVGAQLIRSQSSSLMTAAKGGLHTRAEFVSAAVHSGVKEESKVRRMVAEAGGAQAQLNSLYGLVSYQVNATTGSFIASNLSAPLQPQAPLGSAPTDPRQYRAFAPLYALATANQGLQPDTQNRYASIGATADINFYLNDVFGNQLPGQLDFQHTNYYFDSIVPVDQWPGIVTSYNFGTGTANTLIVKVAPSKAAFANMNKDQAAAALAHYQTINNQITGPGVSFWIASNLSLTAAGLPASVAVDSQTPSQIATLVQAIMAYLTPIAHGQAPGTFPSTPVLLSAVLPATASPLPAAFGVTVELGIARLSSLIDPSLFNTGVLTFPSAQSVSSSVSPDASTAAGSLEPFAAAFAIAFPALALTVGLNNAQSSAVTSKSAARLHTSKRAARKLLRAAVDPATPAAPTTPVFWAISQSLLNITINSSTGLPLYSSPKPLLNALESGSVPMPQMPQGLPQLPTQQTFVDVDLDVYNRGFFTAVDQVLGPATAAAVFMANQSAYNTIAVGREQIATEFGRHEFDWLFSPQSPFTGTPDQLTDASDAFEQQLRAALMSAYSIDTVVQFPVTWNSSFPTTAAGQISLYGQVQPTGAKQANNAGLSTAQIEVPQSGSTGLLTFLYSSPDPTNDEEVAIPLQMNVSHIQVFTEPASQTPPDEARPSLWLQLITGKGLPSNLIPIGPSGSSTVIPVVYRQYPTPPTIIAQSGIGGGSSDGASCTFPNALVKAAAWHYSLQYQAQLISQDQLNLAITYNSTTPGNSSLKAMAVGFTQYTLFEALCRFNAAFPLLQPTLLLNDPTNSLYSAAAGAFAGLVNDVVNNSDWNPHPSFFANALAGQKVLTTDQYTITDKASDPNRVITLTWSNNESSFTGATLSVTALGPDGNPFPNQQPGKVPDGITDTYQPGSAVVDDWVTHQVSINCLNVLTAENARPALQIERNLITLKDTHGNEWSTQNEFVYMTPYVQAPQPVTPLIDNSDPIDVAGLPNQGPSKTCPQSQSSLCQRIATILYDLLTDPGQSAIRGAIADDDSTTFRLKVGCSFSYPLNSAAGQPAPGNPIAPLVPIVLARSFDIDTSVAGQIDAFAVAFAGNISSWASTNGITFGSSPRPLGGQLIFDVTLFAQLSGNSRPLLRLRGLQLALSDVDPA